MPCDQAVVFVPAEAAVARAVHAAANPGFTGYAMELYEGSQLRDWDYVPGNATTVDKLLNSGAAYREFIAGDGRILSPDIDRVRFERYGLALAADGDRWVDHAAVISFINTVQLVASIANVVVDFGVLEQWIVEISTDEGAYAGTVDCARSLAEVPPAAIDLSAPLIDQGLAFFRGTAPGVFQTLATGACRALVVRFGGEALEKLVVAQTVDQVLVGLVGVKPLLEFANDTVPSIVSYFSPRAARSEYYVDWEETPGGQAYIAQVSERPLPVAEFSYAQQRGFRVELDASNSAGQALSYEWAAGGGRIGAGQVLAHDFAEAGFFGVTLTVTDRNAVTAEARSAVTVTAGRVPEVSALSCTPTGNGQAFSMQAAFSDADDDIESVQWYSSISNASPDRETGAGTGSVTLNAPDDASYTRAKVRVVDARGNAVERNCPVEFDTGPPAARIAGARAEEGEALEFTVTLDRAPAEPVIYHYATYRASARDGDYTGHLATALRFGPGEQSKTITVQTTEDTQVERDETFYVYITESTGELPYSGLPASYLARAAGTILDDDETQESALLPRIADAEAEEGEGFVFTVTLERTPAEAVAYHYATYRGTAGSDDYTGHLATALRFGPGARSQTITVRTIEDTDDEDDETFYVYVTQSPGELTASAPARYLARATGTIRDDDEAAASPCTGPTVDIPDAALREAVERALGKAPGTAITPAEMLTLVSVSAPRRNIESLTGLECATGLRILALHDNQITDLSPLAGLTALKWLRLSHNQISDIGPLVANAGWENGGSVFLAENPLSTRSREVHIPALQARGVRVVY